MCSVKVCFRFKRVVLCFASAFVTRRWCLSFKGVVASKPKLVSMDPANVGHNAMGGCATRNVQEVMVLVLVLYAECLLRRYPDM